MRRIAFHPIAVLAVGVLLGLSTPVRAADGERLLTAARIHTSDPGTPLATAIVWGGDGRIIAVGAAADLAERHPGAERIDAGDATVIPGLIDAHVHLVDLGHALMQADLVGARSPDEVVARLQAFAQSLPDDAWLIGRGWDQNLWPDTAFPTAAVLDAAFGDRPVVLERIDGHAAWANSAAMRAVARDLDGDWQPEGGLVLRTDGRATGVFIDTAARLLYDVVPAPDAAWQDRALARALRHVAGLGLTGVHDMGTARREFELMQRFADRGALTLRVRAYALGDSDLVDERCREGVYRHASGRLDMRGVKLMVDGALGSRGAALVEDYSDDPGNRGLLLLEAPALEDAVRRAHGCGLQVATHAIGDRGNHMVLDAYQRVLGDAAVAGDHRWRVEHAQVLVPSDIARFATLRLVASMQPTHATSDMPWAGERLGQARLEAAYAWRSFADAGVPLALGSDFPVELPDPRLGLHAAVTRQDVHGNPPGGWRADQSLTATEALHGFTLGAAWAAFDENEAGRLAPGLRADFVVLGEDPLAIPGRALPALSVRSTWVDGVAVFDAALPVTDAP